jgi:hypothetical protein
VVSYPGLLARLLLTALSTNQREIVPIPMLQSADPATMTAQRLTLDGVAHSYGAGLAVYDPETRLDL